MAKRENVGRPWSDVDKDLLSLYWPERSKRYMCKHLKRSWSAIVDQAYRMDLPFAPRAGTDFVSAVAKDSGFSLKKFRKIMAEYKVPITVYPYGKSTKNPRHVVSIAASGAAIARNLTEKETRAGLARRHGKDHTTISRWLEEDGLIPSSSSRKVIVVNSEAADAIILAREASYEPWDEGMVSISDAARALRKKPNALWARVSRRVAALGIVVKRRGRTLGITIKDAKRCLAPFPKGPAGKKGAGPPPIQVRGRGV